jgi:hypothetical protein
MSSTELVNAFVEGRISRRTLIRRLAAAGVSIGAAVSYAHLLAPEVAARRGQIVDEYPDVGVRILSSDLDKVIDTERLKVRVISSEHVMLVLFAYVKRHGKFELIGEKHGGFDAGRTRTNIPLDKLGPLRGRNRARVVVFAHGEDDDHYPVCTDVPNCYEDFVSDETVLKRD